MISKKYVLKTLRNIYISPLEQCNLKCSMCYTYKSTNKLSFDDIVNFIDKYDNFMFDEFKKHLSSITFCGGEVFLLDYFSDIVNFCTQMGIFVQIITNGTINKIKHLELPNSVNFIVSLDGLEKDHDLNRGAGNFKKSIKFIKDAQSLGFHTEIFSIVCRNNLRNVEIFKNWVDSNIGCNITFLPRKSRNFLNLHPVTNIDNSNNIFGFLTNREILYLMRNYNTLPSINLGCYQISLMSDGNLYSCCEGIEPLGCINDDVHSIVNRYLKRLNLCFRCKSLNCNGCAERNFLCGLNKIIKCNVVK